MPCASGLLTKVNRFSNKGGRGFDVDEEMHYPTRPVDKEKAEHELVINIKKATSTEETSPKQKHVRSKIVSLLTFASADDPTRVHRIHLGLSFVYFILEWLTRSTHSL